MKLYQTTISAYLLLSALLATSMITYAGSPENEDPQPRFAIIIDPIAEMHNSFPPPLHPSAAPQTKKCRRAHQGLYNEIIFCSAQALSFAQVYCPNAIYGFDETTGESRNSFWLYQNQIQLFTDIDKHLLQAIPNPAYGAEPTVVLIYPWNNFSIGTRFNYLPEQDTHNAYAIVYADYHNNELLFDFIPKHDAIIEKNQDEDATRNLMVTIAQNLIDRVALSAEHAVIPFVWGGSSFIRFATDYDFYQENGVWHRNDIEQPYTGYDNSEFVMRMAQMAGVSFPYKTTTAIGLGLAQQALQTHDTLKEGDLIWAPGYVAIISNIERNEIIQARGYSSGYGCIHRCTLSECFTNITTYDELLDAYFSETPIQFRDRQGNPIGQSINFKILKLID
ncbi:MAG TPA: hypothetical protein VGT41_00805 [Candidatus Babeliales bacterium]|nr:hypothetical protein [Candidatus Babeliales bacterium]